MKILNKTASDKSTRSARVRSLYSSSAVFNYTSPVWTYVAHDRAENLTLLTDLYQLTMAQAYFREQQLGEATFSLFIRSYPPNRGYFVVGGIDAMF